MKAMTVLVHTVAELAKRTDWFFFLIRRSIEWFFNDWVWTASQVDSHLNRKKKILKSLTNDTPFKESNKTSTKLLEIFWQKRVVSRQRYFGRNKSSSVKNEDFFAHQYQYHYNVSSFTNSPSFNMKKALKLWCRHV